MINSIGLPNKGLDGYLEQDLPQLAAAAGAADHERHGLDAPRRSPSSSRRVRRARRGRRDRAQRLLPERRDRAWTSAPTRRARRRSCARVRPLTGQAADRQADAEHRRRRARSRRPPRPPGADAVSLINTLRAMALAPARRRSPWLGGGTGGLSGPAVRAVALAQVARGRRAGRRSRSSAWEASQTGAHARDLLEAGATLVAVGTESFRDPLAGARGSRPSCGGILPQTRERSERRVRVRCR